LTAKAMLEWTGSTAQVPAGTSCWLIVSVLIVFPFPSWLMIKQLTWKQP
jgi:hypothetical protein